MSAGPLLMLFLTMKYLKDNFLILLLLIAACASAFIYLSKKNVIKAIDDDLPAVKNEILTVNKTFLAQTNELLQLAENNGSKEVLIKKFDDLRITYKKMEWAVEYFLPHSARFLNGPALPEIEFAEHIVIEPEGLQLLEELIYDDPASNKEEIIRNIKKLINKSGTIKANFEVITVNRAQVFDALRQQIFRISSLSIAGFDTPVSGNHLLEMPHALNSIAKTLMLISGGKSDALSMINSEIKSANEILQQNSDKNTFDYLTFISKHLNKISELILQFKNEQYIENIEVTSALSKTAKHFYDKNTFDFNAFVPGENFKFSGDKASLGKQLFNDPMLSKDQNRSCATCHNAGKAFTDGLPRSFSLEENPLQRNTPSLNYASLQHGQFWDMRNEDLEGQSSEVITNKDEMHGDLNEIIARINKNSAYQKAFQMIYKSPKAETWQLQNLLASYIRSLATFNSSFDEYMRGNQNALNENQKKGFNLFMGKAKCATCHFLPLFNGTVPPNYTKTEQEVLGTAENDSNKKMDADKGRGRFHETVPSLQHSFKTPTVRNINKTAPYMHNGGYRTLEDVMHFYNEGGGKGFGFDVENQTLPEDKLHLTKTEISQIIEFMKALDDK